MEKRIAIFGSGAGTNARKIIEHFVGSQEIKIVRIYSNKNSAGILDIGTGYRIPVTNFGREELEQGNVLQILRNDNTDWIILAGFLWKIPDAIIAEFPNRIINIHPALLPKFGGKGMYGMKVHQAVKQSGECETGITIHYVDGHYDNGDIICQQKLEISKDDSAETIAAKVQELEHYWYPRIIEYAILNS